MISRVNGVFGRFQALYGKSQDKMFEFFTSCREDFDNIKDRLDMHEQEIGKIVPITTLLEETTMNVLLAIRQNDYLQAWYPAQQGYAQMKVAGPHPAKLSAVEHV